MAKKPLLLQALAFSHKELELLLRCAIQIMHADTRIRIEETSIINLFPSLLKIAKEDAPEELKSEWRKKLIITSYAIRTGSKKAGDDIEDLCALMTDYKKRSLCLVILFLIAGSDKHIDQREIRYIVQHIALPWNYSVFELIDLLKEESERLFIPDKMIHALQSIHKKTLLE